MKIKRFSVMSGMVLALSLIGLLSSCSGGGTDGGDGTDGVSDTTPGTPTEVSLILGNGQVTVSWTAPTNTGLINGGSTGTITKYTVYWGTSSGVDSTSPNTHDETSGTSTIITGLANDTAYFFVVTAHNATGESAISNEDSTAVNPLANIAATQIKITDIDNSGQFIFPANFMVFDIIAEDFEEESRHLEFLLVPVNSTAPTTLTELRVEHAFSDFYYVRPSETKVTRTVPLYLKTVLRKGETTGIYFGHGSSGTLGLSPNTAYGLYVSQTNATTTVPQSLGQFTTGAAATNTTTTLVQNLTMTENSDTRTYYMKEGNFIAWLFIGTASQTFNIFHGTGGLILYANGVVNFSNDPAGVYHIYNQTGGTDPSMLLFATYNFMNQGSGTQYEFPLDTAVLIKFNYGFGQTTTIRVMHVN